MASNNRPTNRRSSRSTSNKSATKTPTRSQNRRKRNEGFSFSITDPTTIIALIGVAGIILSLKSLGLLFTVILIIGVVIIVAFSLLFTKLRKKRGWRIVTNILIVIFLLGFIAVLAGSTAFMIYIVKKAPDFDVGKLNRTQSTVIYDKDDKEIAELGTERREIISFDDMSQTLIDALIATEDSRFYQHNGFDAARFLKASIGQAAGSNAGGASTLSMQVIKNSFTSTESHGVEGIIRKFTDIYLSVFKLEKNYSKEQIIEFYVNNHYLGSNAYGVEQAAQTYFGKSAKSLNLAESALIVGLFQAPTYYNPYTNPKAATARRDRVLYLMKYHGYITEEEYELAKAIPVESLLVGEAKNDSTPFGAYVDTVVEEMIDKYKVNPYNTSLKIYTNMDRKKQTGLDNIFNGKKFNWENKIVQAGIAAVDVKTGKIVAIGAGRNRTDARSYNFATMINRQIGSTAKPIFDYAPGMEYKDWSTYEIFDDSPHTYSDGKVIRNSDRGYMGNISLRVALAQSRNIPALKAFQQNDKKKIIEFVKKMGIQPEVTNGTIHEAHAIGAFNGSNPLQMAAAYATFANGGYYNEPYSVTKFVYRDTGETVEHKGKSVKVMSDSTAFMITDCLVSAVKNGVSNGAAVNGVNVAAKTGTTNYDEAIVRKYNLPNDVVNDAWIVGFDPDTAVGMWYGYEKINKKYYSTNNTAVVQRSRLYKAAGNVLFTKNGKNFKAPKSVVKLAVYKGSNPARIAGEGTPEELITYEYFKKGTEPTETSTTYNKLNNISGLSVNYNETSKVISMSWKGVSPAKDALTEWGKFGYKIYRDGKYLGFTTNTSYKISNVSNPEGIYKVVTSYEKYSGNDSSGASAKLTVKKKENSYTSELLVQKDKSYTAGSALDSVDMNPSVSDIRVYENGVDITSKCNISTYITTNGAPSEGVTTENAGVTFVITYNVTYNGSVIVQPLSRTVRITE